MLMRVNKNPSPQELRQFGWTLLIGFGLIGVFLFWRGKPHLSYGIGGGGAGLGVLALLSAPLARIIYRVWMGWAFVMGTVVTRVILAFLFFVVIMPVGLLFRCIGRDPLRLKKNPGLSTYWDEHRKITDASYYDRLF